MLKRLAFLSVCDATGNLTTGNLTRVPDALSYPKQADVSSDKLYQA